MANMTYTFSTALLCFLGWASHWFASWGEAWKTEHKSLIDFLDDNPPAFWFSLSTTLAVYLLGPSALIAIGIKLPDPLDTEGLKLVVAFAAGYMADSVVYKIANFVRK
jgi:hypothetical protein